MVTPPQIELHRREDEEKEQPMRVLKNAKCAALW
jgi:hypothetical protein